MTWVTTAPVNDTEADERVHAVGALAVRMVDTLEVAAAALTEAATSGHSEDTDALHVLSAQVVEARAQLVDLFKIHKALLSRETVDDLREGFRLANIHEPDRRKKVIEDFLEHDVERIQELTPDEAKALRAHLTTLEEPF